MKHLILVIALTFTANAVDMNKMAKLRKKAMNHQERAVKAFDSKKYTKCYFEAINGLNVVYRMGVEAIGNDKLTAQVHKMEYGFNGIKDICEKLGGL